MGLITHSNYTNIFLRFIIFRKILDYINNEYDILTNCNGQPLGVVYNTIMSLYLVTISI